MLAPVLVVNPTKTHALERFVLHVTQACTTYGLPAPDVRETTVLDPGEGMARAAVASGATLVLAAGGDGTVRAVCAGLSGSGVPMGVLPLGTGNLLARNLDLPLDLDRALQVALTGRDRVLDLGEATVGDAGPTAFVVMAGLGFDAQMMADAPEGLKQALGWPAYVVSGLRHLRDPAGQVELVLDGAPGLLRPARGVVVGNVGSLQGGLALLPDALPDDGLLDVVLLSPPSVRHWVRLAIRLALRRPDTGATRWTVRRLELRTTAPTHAQLDGESLGEVRSLVLEVRPGALVVRVRP